MGTGDEPIEVNIILPVAVSKERTKGTVRLNSIKWLPNFSNLI